MDNRSLFHVASALATGLLCGVVSSGVGGMTSSPYAAILGTIASYAVLATLPVAIAASSTIASNSTAVPAPIAGADERASVRFPKFLAATLLTQSLAHKSGSSPISLISDPACSSKHLLGDRRCRRGVRVEELASDMGLAARPPRKFSKSPRVLAVSGRGVEE